MSKDHSKYLQSNEDGYIRITPKVKKLAEELTKGATTEKEKVEKIYDYVRNKKYFLVPARPTDEIIDSEFLDCGSKHTLISALNRSINIPTRIALVECPVEIFRKTLKHLKVPRWADLVGQSIISTMEGGMLGGTHYGVEAYYDKKWHFMDATLNDDLCSHFHGEKKEKCLSKKGVASVLDCKYNGHSLDLPNNAVLISNFMRFITDITGATNKFMKSSLALDADKKTDDGI